MRAKYKIKVLDFVTSFYGRDWNGKVPVHKAILIAATVVS